MINKNDIAILADLADYRMMTVGQLALLRERNEAALRRRVKMLVDEGVVEALPVSLARGRGHPVGVFGVGRGGYELLREHGVLPEQVQFELARGTGLVPQADHQLLMNWCRLHLVNMERQIPRLSFKFLSCNSPFSYDCLRGSSVVCEDLPATDSSPGENIRLIPDAAFAVTDSEQQKTLLFFLEIDMATEPVSSSNPKKTDIAKKIANYQVYFQSRAYKRYENEWGIELNGFRLLFVCNKLERMTSLCRVVQALPPSDFVWLTCRARMFDQGISGAIWQRGGKSDNRQWSILGRLTQRTPFPVFSNT